MHLWISVDEDDDQRAICAGTIAGEAMAVLGVWRGIPANRERPVLITDSIGTVLVRERRDHALGMGPR